MKGEGLGKRFTIKRSRQRYRTLGETVTNALKNPASLFRAEPDDELWAVRDASFEIKRGEVVGVIGHNGAGKSTLLKILARITPPTTGVAWIHGRVGSLLEVGTGFHPELTGRENVFLNASILGMRRSEVAAKLDEIVAFADVAQFLDMPVKRYSSGMQLRLAFAVAAHLEPEILLVDEVLAVGDLSFQEKCLGKMGQVVQGGRTVLLVSHNLGAIWSLCPRTLWMDRGTVRAFDATEGVLHQYRESVRAAGGSLLGDPSTRPGSGKLRTVRLAIDSGAGLVQSGAPVAFELDYKAAAGAAIDELEVHLIVANDHEVRLFDLTNRVAGPRFSSLPPEGRLRCEVPSLPLVPGEYLVHVSLSVRRELADKAMAAARLTVAEGDFYGTGQLPDRKVGGDLLVKHGWSVVDAGR